MAIWAAVLASRRAIQPFFFHRAAAAALWAALLATTPVGSLQAQLPRQDGRLASPSDGAVHALVIGINRYKSMDVPELEGAVPDARDLADVLSKAGAASLTLLVDAEATRANVEAAFDRLEGNARSGDLVVVTFAGHGAQEPERVAGSEPDGKDEVFLLWGFGTEGDDTRERLIDDEIFERLKRLSMLSARVLFLADSCHGGGLTKTADPRGPPLRVRGMEAVSRPDEVTRGKYYLPREKDRLTIPKLSPDDNATRELPHLTFLGAVEPHVLAPEIAIHGVAGFRGAASYALARALEGRADANRDGRTTRRELLAYMRKTVRNLTQNWQNPILEPRLDNALRQDVFRSGSPPRVEERVAARRSEPLKVAVLGRGMSQAPATASSGSVQFTLSSADSHDRDVTFDTETRDFIDGSGSVLAFDSAPDRLSSVVDRVRAGRELAALADGRAVDVWLTPHEKDYAAGEQFKLNIGDASGRYLTLFNLAGNGKVQYLFPTPKADPQASDDIMTFDLVALPPFGTDLMVVAATERRMQDLELKLRLLDGKLDPLAAVEALKSALGPNDLLGLISYSTRPVKK